MRSEDKNNKFRGPIGSIFEACSLWLGTQPHSVIWIIVVIGMTAVFAMDCFMAGLGVQSGLFYLLPISLACWRLSFQTGLALGVLASILVACLAIFVMSIPVSSAIGTLVMNALAVSVLGGVVTSIRHSVEYERFVAGLDHITGAMSRPSFEQHAEKMIASAAAKSSTLLLAYLDLDGFKAVNDLHGHAVGDELLKRFAQMARAALRREDCFGRMGGDEFAALMSLRSNESAQDVANRLHQRLTLMLDDNAAVTCSMGALTVPPDGNLSLKELLREADHVMYTTKRSGKNGVHFRSCAPPFDPANTLVSVKLMEKPTS